MNPRAASRIAVLTLLAVVTGCAHHPTRTDNEVRAFLREQYHAEPARLRTMPGAIRKLPDVQALIGPDGRDHENFFYRLPDDRIVAVRYNPAPEVRLAEDWRVPTFAWITVKRDGAILERGEHAYFSTP